MIFQLQFKRELNLICVNVHGYVDVLFFKGSRTGTMESFFLEAKLFGGLVMTGQCHMYLF